MVSSASYVYGINMSKPRWCSSDGWSSHAVWADFMLNISNHMVFGPVDQSWHIAQISLKSTSLHCLEHPTTVAHKYNSLLVCTLLLCRSVSFFAEHFLSLLNICLLCWSFFSAEHFSALTGSFSSLSCIFLFIRVVFHLCQELLGREEKQNLAEKETTWHRRKTTRQSRGVNIRGRLYLWITVL